MKDMGLLVFANRNRIAKAKRIERENRLMIIGLITLVLGAMWLQSLIITMGL